MAGVRGFRPLPRYLEQHYRLVILSNVDSASFQGSNAKLGETFEAVYKAQDIGSYKPDPPKICEAEADAAVSGLEAMNLAPRGPGADPGDPHHQHTELA